MRVGILLKRRENSSAKLLILEISSCLLYVRIHALGEKISSVNCECIFVEITCRLSSLSLKAWRRRQRKFRNFTGSKKFDFGVRGTERLLASRRYLFNKL